MSHSEPTATIPKAAFGKLRRIVGTMGAGKTKRLLARYKKEHPGRRVLIKYAKDVGRFEGDDKNVVSHDLAVSVPADFIVTSLDDAKMIEFIHEHDIRHIYIDDAGHFQELYPRIYQFLYEGRQCDAQLHQFAVEHEERGCH